METSLIKEAISVSDPSEAARTLERLLQSGLIDLREDQAKRTVDNLKLEKLRLESNRAPSSNR